MKKMTKLIAGNKIRRLARHQRYDEALEMLKEYRVRRLSVTKSTLKSEFGLKPKDIEKLHFIEVENPEYKSAPPMKLYLRTEAHRLWLKKKKAEENKKVK